MEPKPWWQSKTLWINAAALVAAVGTWITTQDTAALVVAGMSMINFILRVITKQPLDGP
jgi:hypothetical protein